jgi:hypothetical protein
VLDVVLRHLGVGRSRIGNVRIQRQPYVVAFRMVKPSACTA